MSGLIIYLQMLETQEEKQNFSEIYEENRGLMYYVANNILGDSYDAEDAVHQAFLALARNFKKYSHNERPQMRALLVVIVERKAIDMLRARRPAAEYDDAVSGLEIPVPGEGNLSDAMARLPAHYRQALLLRYDNGYSAVEVAQLLDLTPSNARKLIYRAKKALRRLMDEMELEEKII